MPDHYSNITVPRNQAFFVALCKTQQHSFIALGIDDIGIGRIIGAFGKKYLRAPTSLEQCAVFFSGIQTRIASELVFFKWHLEKRRHVPSQLEISYKALAIDFEEYHKLLYYFKEMVQKEDFYLRHYKSNKTLKPTFDNLSPLLDGNTGCILCNGEAYHIDSETEEVRSIDEHQQLKLILQNLPLNAKKTLASEEVSNEFEALTKIIPLHKQLLWAYCPIKITDTSIELEWKNLIDLDDSKKPNSINSDFSQYKKLTFWNTCRHNATHLIRLVTHLTDLGKGISSFFLWSPPLKATIDAGILRPKNGYLYVMPKAPEFYPGMTLEKAAVLRKLYNRLDALIPTESFEDIPFLSQLYGKLNNLRQTEAYQATTRKKFEAIKELYESQVTNEKADLNMIIAAIKKWRDDHEDLIKSHRNSHWISFRTATETLFDEIAPKSGPGH